MGRHLRPALFLAGFVAPVRGHTSFRHPVHVLGPYLHLNALTESAEQQCVQRLVTVGLRDRDIVFKLTGNWLVQIVHKPQHSVTVIGRPDDDPDREDITHFHQWNPSLLHLTVDAVNVLFPTDDGRFDSGLLHLLGDVFFCFLDDFPAITAALPQFLVDCIISLRVKVTKT